MWNLGRFTPIWPRNRAQTKEEKYERKKKVRYWMRVAVLFGLVAVGYFLHGWMARHSATVSDQSVVYLTLVLIYVTYLQWDVTAEQNIAIERQLDQMEFQQRAWLATSAIDIEPLVTGLREGQDSVDISDWGIEVINTGSTPGIIAQSRIEPLLKPIGESCKDNLVEIESRARELTPRRTVVAPGHKIVFRFSDSGGTISWNDATIHQIRKGGGYTGNLIGAFIYQDVFGVEHKTLCAYRYTEATQQLTNNYQDGEMT